MQNHWRPTAAIETLRKRAQILEKIRRFFSERHVLEVETPLLCQHTVTDPYLQSLSSKCYGKDFFLQTSPEYCMKRLIAAGSGCIYQICKAFRADEFGRYHNPEFTILEWYRINYNHFDLMNEADQLLQLILGCEPAEKMSYQDLFIKYLKIDPLIATLEQLTTCCQHNRIQLPDNVDLTIDLILQVLMSDAIEPKIGLDKPIFIFHYPKNQAALSKIHPPDPRVSERFEIYYSGLELANGFHELTNAQEQQKRFEENNLQRKKLQLPEFPIDKNLIAALNQNFPKCSGIALGVDRLVMLATQKVSISDVIGFSINNC